MGRITAVLRKGFRGWSLRPVRGKGVTVLFQDRSVAVVAIDVVGYGRPETVASRFAQAYHARWPAVRLEAFGAAARRMPVTDAVSPTSADQPPPMEKIDDLSPKTALSSNEAWAEVNPRHRGNEVEDITGAAGAEPGRGSTDASIDPPAEDARAEAEAETCLPEREERTSGEDMADLADVDPPEFPEDDLEKDEEDAFRLLR